MNFDHIKHLPSILEHWDHKAYGYVMKQTNAKVRGRVWLDGGISPVYVFRRSFERAIKQHLGVYEF